MKRSTILIACLWACWVVSPASAALLFGVSYDGDIYEMNQSTGARQLFMIDTGIQWCDAADSPNLDGFFATANGGSLYDVDIVNKTIAPIGTYGAASICTLAYAEPTLPGNPGVLYGSDLQKLYTIDMNTGAATLIAPISGAGDTFIGVGSMDYDPVAQRLYIVNDFGASSKLSYVDTGTGVATVVGSLDIPVTDIWYDRDTGKMYGTHHSTTQLYEIDTTNAHATPIGATPTGDEACERIFGLGGPGVPEPAAGLLFLLAAGLPGLVIRRRR